MAKLIAVTGMRIGELLAVRWRSLDLEIGALSVCHASSDDLKLPANRAYWTPGAETLRPCGGTRREVAAITATHTRANSAFGNHAPTNAGRLCCNTPARPLHRST